MSQNDTERTYAYEEFCKVGFVRAQIYYSSIQRPDLNIYSMISPYFISNILLASIMLLKTCDYTERLVKLSLLGQQRLGFISIYCCVFIAYLHISRLPYHFFFLF